MYTAAVKYAKYCQEIPVIDASAEYETMTVFLRIVYLTLQDKKIVINIYDVTDKKMAAELCNGDAVARSDMALYRATWQASSD